jgi:hypothetical protein
LNLIDIDIVLLIPILVGIALTSIILLVLYFIYLRPRIKSPLPNERGLGWWILRVPTIGWLDGYVCTAKTTVDRALRQIVESESDKTVLDQAEDVKKILETCYPLAQRVGRKVYLLLFDQNPQDQRFMDADPDKEDTYRIHGIQDMCSLGEWKGRHVVALKLNPETRTFTDDERKWVKSVGAFVKYLEDAAKNKLKLRELEDERNYFKESNEKKGKRIAEMRSDLDRGKSALGQKPLTVPESVKVPGAWREKMKEWFSWPQLLVAAIAYLLSPYILTWTGWNLTPPSTTYFAAFVTVVGFFLLPLAKKVFGRWL